VESAVAWTCALERRDGPSALLFSRQNVAFALRSEEALAQVRRGGYVLCDAPWAKAVLIATGSEVPLALEAQKRLAEADIPVRVVSMASSTVFDRQDAAYRESVLPRALPRIAVEAGVTGFWRKYVGPEGAVVGIDRFGESAPAGDLFRHFGFTAENVAKAVRSVIS
jgi:transketolase